MSSSLKGTSRIPYRPGFFENPMKHSKRGTILIYVDKNFRFQASYSSHSITPLNAKNNFRTGRLRSSHCIPAWLRISFI